MRIGRTVSNGVASGNEDASVVSAIVSRGHTVNLKVIAEGVETPEQLEFRQMLGCDQYQGYHYSAAMPANELADLIRGRNRSQEPAAAQDSDRTRSIRARRRSG